MVHKKKLKILEHADTWNGIHYGRTKQFRSSEKEFNVLHILYSKLLRCPNVMVQCSSLFTIGACFKTLMYVFIIFAGKKVKSVKLCYNSYAKITLFRMWD